VTSTTTVAEVTGEYVEQGRAHSLQLQQIPEGLIVFRIHGPFLFGSSDKLTALEERIPDLPQVVLLRLRNMTAIDATGLHAIERFADRLKDSGRTLLLCGMRDQPERMMARAEFHNHIGPGNILPSIEAAFQRARQLLSDTTPSASSVPREDSRRSSP
jgi:SulP family sulfate permease